MAVVVFIDWLLFTCSTFSTFRKHFNCIVDACGYDSVYVWLLVHVNLTIESNKSIKWASKWNTIFVISSSFSFILSFCSIHFPEILPCKILFYYSFWFYFSCFLISFLLAPISDSHCGHFPLKSGFSVLFIYELWLMKFSNNGFASPLDWFRSFFGCNRNL